MSVRILIVDDNNLAADSLAKMLDSTDITVETLYSGRDCLLRLKVPPKIDFLILDISMPEISGIDVIKELKTWVPGPDLKVFIFTQHKDFGVGPLTDLIKRIRFEALLHTSTLEHGLEIIAQAYLK